MTLSAGQRVGRYEVAEVLGEGGMSTSYRAVDSETGADVVLKVPLAGLIGDLAAYGRYERETEITLKLNHPNLQRALASSRLDGTPMPVLVLEYVDGSSFRGWLGDHGQLPVDQAVGLALQIASALTHCHDQGIVHRDLKPENLLITADGTLKLLDFGIALRQGARRLTWGPLGQAVGTPDYMAPEQIRGERGDARTDIYALGCMLFEMLAGRTPYESRSDSLQVMKEHVNREAPGVRMFRPDISEELELIIAKAIRREPKERPASIREFADQLLRPDSIDRSQFAWKDKGSIWAGLTPVAGEMPSLRRALLLVLIVFSSLAAIGLLAQMAPHAAR